MEIGLVNCTKSKRNSSAHPGDLYDESALFRKARAYCKQFHDEWYILSAKHHLLHPDGAEIEPYNKSLTNATKAERQQWAIETFPQLQEAELLTEENTLVIHAGQAYYGELLPMLENTPVMYELLTEGLGIGSKMRWYNENVPGLATD